MAFSVRAVPSRFIVPLAGIATLVAVAILREVAPHVYFVVLKIMMTEPAPTPFSDWEWIPSAIRCWAEGVDVYVNMACYRVWPNQVFNYSPLILRATFLRSGEDWVNVSGLAIGIAFFLSISLLPRPKTWRDVAYALAITLSSGGWLAVERGNADLIIFVMFAVCLALLCRTGLVRYIAYPILILAGLLKFYPFVALIVAVRERFWTVVAVGLAGCAALGLLVAGYHDELVAMARNLPQPSVYTLQFGRENLPYGLASTVVRWLVDARSYGLDDAMQIGAAVKEVVAIGLIGGAVVSALALARRMALPELLQQLDASESTALLLGAAVVVGCFFAGPNVIYRGLYLLLVIPGVGTLVRRSRAGVWTVTMTLMVLVMWEPVFEAVLSAAGLAERIGYQAAAYTNLPRRPAGYLLWLLREVAWWWIVVVLMAVVGSIVVRSRSYATLWGYVGGHRLLPASPRVSGAPPHA